MSIRITKLHLMLFLTAVMLTFFFFLQQSQQYSMNALFDRFPYEIIKKKPAFVAPAAESRDIPAQSVIRDTIEQDTRQVIAVAGEDMKIAIKQGKDVAEGQSVLRRAKDLFSEEQYRPAMHQAQQAIEEFKIASVKLLSTYRVKRRDTLWAIARRQDVYGRGSKWVTLWRANEEKISDFDYIYSGQVLTIPRQ